MEHVKSALLMFTNINNTPGRKDSETLLRKIQKMRCLDI
jgi:hypothetical protein